MYDLFIVIFFFFFFFFLRQQMLIMAHIYLRVQLAIKIFKSLHYYY
jgi:hypothetical protein